MIVVFGSINLDIVTPVPRIAGPGETVLGLSYTQVPGGKGANQALAARRSGAQVILVGATGADGFADTALSLLRAEGVDLSRVARSVLPTGAAFISVDAQGQNAITVAAGANAAVAVSQLAGLSMSRADTLLLQREVPDQVGAAAARYAKTHGARVILNLAPAGAVPDRDLDDLDILVMNEFEAAELAAEKGLGPEHAHLALTMHERHGLDVVVTLGAAGAVAWESGVEHRVASLSIAPIDTTGAGDTFVGAFATALDAGLPFNEALRRGAVAGSLACLKPGAQTSIPALADIERAMAL